MDPTLQYQEENQRLRKAVEELSILNELARVISSTMSLTEVIENVVKRSVKAVHAQQGVITLVDEGTPSVPMKTFIRALDSTSDHQQFHLDQNILGWMMINKKPLVSNDFTRDPRFSGVRIEGDVRTLLCVPLLVKNRLIGILSAFNKREGGIFTDDDTRLLSIIGTQSAQVLENARLYEQERSFHMMQEEMKLAARIQLDLLPKTSQSIPGYELAGRTIPAQLVGGDYYDFIPIDSHRIAVSLGDVSGKGLPASLLMSHLHATIRGQTLTAKSACECICRSNKLLHASTSSEKFVTLFYGILDSETHMLNFCNAGQDPPVHLSPGKELARLRTGGIVLSMLDQFPYEEETISLSPGDTLVFYSDGVTEAMNVSGDQYGEEKLLDLLREQEGGSATQLIDAVVSSVHRHVGNHPQSDDITIVVVKRMND